MISFIFLLNFFRTSSQAITIPGGRLAMTAHVDVHKLSLSAYFSSGVNVNNSVTWP